MEMKAIINVPLKFYVKCFIIELAFIDFFEFSF